MVEKLVQEQLPHRFGRSRITCEEGPLDDLGEVAHHEDRTVEIAEEGLERAALIGAERLRCVVSHGETV